MKKILTIIILNLIFCNSGFADNKEVYYCYTDQISTTKKGLVKSNYKSIEFSFKLKDTIVGKEKGMVIFSDNAISEGLINTLELGNEIYIDTHMKKEQFMASLGSGTKVWYHEGNLAISSFFQDDRTNVILIVNSLATCKK